MKISKSSKARRNQTSILIRGRENHFSTKPGGKTDRHSDGQTEIRTDGHTDRRKYGHTNGWTLVFIE